MNRKEIIQQIGQLESNHCQTCEIIAEYRKDKSGASLQCITKCEIGKQIRALGRQLESKHNDNKKEKRHRPFTKEQFIELCKTHTGKQLSDMFGMDLRTISAYKSRWKILQKRGPVATITREKVEQLAGDNTNEQIAKLLGYSTSTIRRYKSRWGIKGKNKKPGKEKKGA